MPAKFSYDKALKDIEIIIEEIENESLNVDELTQKVKKASELIKKCKINLTNTKNEVKDLLDDLEV